MHTLHKKQCTNPCQSAEGGFECHGKQGEQELGVRGLCRAHSPQRAAGLLIRGAPVADVAEGVAGLQFGFLALRGGLSFLPLAEELLERLELACLFLVCG